MTSLGIYLLLFIFGFIGSRILSLFRDLNNKASGTIIVTQDEDGTYLTLNINGSVHDFITKDEALLQIKHAPVSAQKTDPVMRKY